MEKAAALADEKRKMRRALLGSGEGEASEHDEAGQDMQPQDNGAMMYSFQGSTIGTEVFLGRGTYGAVYRAKSDCGRTYALKLAVRDDTIQDVGTESSYLCKARHPGVVCCYGLAVAVAVAKSPSVAMVMECAEASLLELLRHTPQHSMEARWQMTLQILRATEYIHSVDILHLDIKPNNILAWKKIRMGMAVRSLSYVISEWLDAAAPNDGATVFLQHHGEPLSYTSPAVAK